MRAAHPQTTAAVQPAPVILPPSGDDPLAALRAELNARSGRKHDACSRLRECCIYAMCRARIVPPISWAAGRAGGRLWSLGTARLSLLFSLRSGRYAAGVHPPSFRLDHRLSDWPDCRIELRCLPCQGRSAIIPVKLLIAHHGDATFRHLLPRLRCGSCRGKPAPAHLCAGHRTFLGGGPADWAIELVPPSLLAG